MTVQEMIELTDKCFEHYLVTGKESWLNHTHKVDDYITQLKQQQQESHQRCLV